MSLPTLAVTGSTGALGAPGRPRAGRSRCAPAPPRPLTGAGAGPARSGCRARGIRRPRGRAPGPRGRDDPVHGLGVGDAGPARAAPHVRRRGRRRRGRHVVYTSFYGAAPDCTFTLGRDHWATEEHIRASGHRGSRSCATTSTSTSCPPWSARTASSVGRPATAGSPPWRRRDVARSPPRCCSTPRLTHAGAPTTSPGRRR